MRVIAGTARHIPLVCPRGDEVRPTTDKIKETIFNMINFDIPGCSFLDLFGGTGGIGIEAKSRGAEYVCIVEKGREPLKAIEANLEKTKFRNEIELIAGDALYAVNRFAGKRQFDFIFMDPPYHAGLERSTLEAIVRANILKEDGAIIVESDDELDLSFVDSIGLSIYKEKIYKTNKHTFICRKDAE